MDKLNYLEIGKRIKLKRKQMHLTQEKLSEIIDVSPSYNSSQTFTEVLKSIPEKNHKLFINLCENISNSLK